jgi:hypothetical protein
MFWAAGSSVFREIKKISKKNLKWMLTKAEKKSDSD